jgi:integrase/recombinase XerD
VQFLCKILQMFNATVSIFLDTRRKKANEKYPVKLRVYYNYKTQYYPLKMELTKEAYQQTYVTQKPRSEYKENRIKIHAIESKANELINSLEVFTFQKFEKKMFGQLSNKECVFSNYKQYIQSLIKNDKVTTASNYMLSMKSLKTFLASSYNINTDELLFSNVNVEFLNQYERWMVAQHKSITTVGIYLRPLRAIFNAAIQSHIVSLDSYPFGKRRYQIPAGRRVKKALSKKDLKTLLQFNLPASSEKAKARDLFFFCYVCNGMNIRDLCNLKQSNIQNDRIVFARNKTKNTSKGNSKSIIVPLIGLAKDVIAKYGNKDQTPNKYVFPFFNECETESAKVNASQRLTRFVNQHIKILATAAGITEKVSTNWARHSFTTISVQNGASLEFIQDSLGHQNISTTMHYWGGFEHETKRENAEKLIEFE